MATAGERRQPATIEDTLDELRSTFDDGQQPDTWRRNLALIGILAALFGVAAWQALLSDRNRTALVLLELTASVAPEYEWVEPGFAQVFAAYSQTGNRVRLQRSGGSVTSAEVDPFLSPSGAGPISDANLDMRLEGPDTDGALTLSLALDHEGTRYEHELVGQVEALADLASRATLQLFAWLSIDPYTVQDVEIALEELPRDERAARHYALGTQALRRGEGRSAVDELSQALAIEPSHPMINAALAAALELAGYRSRASQQVRIAFDNSQRLSRERQLAIEAQMRLLQRDWEEAETLYAALSAFYPEEISYGLALAKARQSAGQADSALSVLEQLRRQPTFAGDPRIDLAEARVWFGTGEWQRGVAVVESAIEKAQLLGHTGTLARALVLRAEMEGDPSGGGLELAEELFAEIGDLRGQSQLLREFGDRHVANGRLGAAIAAYNDAERLSVRLGNDADVAAARQARVIATDLAGQLEAGYALKQVLLEDAVRRQLHARAAIVKENLGVSAFKLGRLEEALAWYDAALADFKQVDDQIGIAWYPYRKGLVLASMGDLQVARELFDESPANAVAHPEGNLALHTRYEVARLAVFAGDPRARDQLQVVSKAYQDAELHLDAAATEVVLAHLEIVEGDLDRARVLLRKALSVFEESGSAYYTVRAQALLVRARDFSVCADLATAAARLEHREDALLGKAALKRCPGTPIDLSGELEAAEGAQLFEAVIALLSEIDGGRAQALGHSRGWMQSAYWSAR
ncbi:MAG: tetratricopeptide repeat protein [Pseudomonadota bacterium]